MILVSAIGLPIRTPSGSDMPRWAQVVIVVGMALYAWLLLMIIYYL